MGDFLYMIGASAYWRWKGDCPSIAEVVGHL